jgi:cation diffusion facilitator family transporter
MPLEIVIPEVVLPTFSNQAILELAVLLFLIFAIAEIAGAYVSGSLSLLADSISMFSDIISYVCNIYVEWYKSNYGGVSRHSRFYLEVIIPIASVVLLIATTLYTTFDAITIIAKPPKVNDVNVNFLYGFSIFNFVVDFACWMLFSLRGREAFLEPVKIPQLSLDTSISFDEESDYGDLEDTDFEILNKNLVQEDNEPKFFAFTEFWKLMTFQNLSEPEPILTNNNTSSSSKDGGEKQLKKSNLNMLSAFAHIIGDTLRTFAVLIAALTSTLFHVDGDICDAWAALIASLTILVICSSLISEIRKSYVELRDEDENGIVMRSSPFQSKKDNKGKNDLYMQLASADDDGEETV